MSKSSEIYFHNTTICLSRLHNSFDKAPTEALTLSLYGLVFSKKTYLIYMQCQMPTGSCSRSDQ